MVTTILFWEECERDRENWADFSVWNVTISDMKNWENILEKDYQTLIEIKSIADKKIKWETVVHIKRIILNYAAFWQM